MLLSRLAVLTAMLTRPLLTQSMPLDNNISHPTADAWTSGISDTAPTTIPTSVDVVVIGAGFSGLQTAYDLHAAGLSCLVLEANGRIGGRSYSYPLRNQPGMVELGATWINKDTQPEVYALTREFGLDVVEQNGEGEVVWEDLQGRVWRQGKDDPVVVSSDCSGGVAERDRADPFARSRQEATSTRRSRRCKPSSRRRASSTSRTQAPPMPEKT